MAVRVYMQLGGTKCTYTQTLVSFSARTSQLDVQQQSMQTQVKILQEELSKSTMRYNQLEGVKQMGEAWAKRGPSGR